MSQDKIRIDWSDLNGSKPGGERKNEGDAHVGNAPGPGPGGEPRRPSYDRGVVAVAPGGPATAAAPGEALAQLAGQAGVNVDERPSPVYTRTDADQELLRWKRLMPLVKSLYQPSGILPFPAFVYMVVGVVLGALAGGIVGIIVANLGLLATYALGFLTKWLADATGRVFCCPAILSLLVLLAGYFFSFMGAGVAAGLCVTGMGKNGKNRNVTAAALLGTVSAALAAVAYVQCYLFFESDARSSQDVLGKINEYLSGATPQSNITQEILNGGFSFWGTAVGVLIATISAWVTSVQEVHGAKFCEECQCYMGKRALRKVSFLGMRLLAKPVVLQSMESVVMVMDQGEGAEGVPLLFVCPTCGKGYFEVSAHFEQHWKTIKKDGTSKAEEKKETWLVASRAMGAMDTEMLRPYVAGEAG